jgi:hypothetical protein
MKDTFLLYQTMGRKMIQMFPLLIYKGLRRCGAASRAAVFSHAAGRGAAATVFERAPAAHQMALRVELRPRMHVAGCLPVIAARRYDALGQVHCFYPMI